MHFLKFTNIFYLLSFALLLVQTILGIDSAITSRCSSVNFNPGKDYASSVNQLITILVSDAPRLGFAKSSIGKESGQVYGVALCRADINKQDCQACLETAASEIRVSCPQSKAAIIWHSSCTLRYSDKNFFGAVDYYNFFYQCNPESTVKRQATLFRIKRRVLFRRLAEEAHNNRNLFAVANIVVGKEKMYGMAECTRDISSGRCHKCLKQASRAMGAYCYGSRGGKFYTGSCNTRFEMYPFMDDIISS